MSKFVILFVVAAAVVTSIRGQEDFPNFSNFPLFKPFGLDNEFPQQPFAPFPVLNPDYIKNLKPGPGQTVEAASASSSSSSETVNGVTKTKNSGRVVTNDDGKVTDVSF